MFVYRHEYTAQRCHSIEQIVDHKMHLAAIASCSPGYQGHAVEASKRMVAHKHYPALRRRRQFVFAHNGESDVEVGEYTFAELRSLAREIISQQFVEAVLTHGFLKIAQHKAGHQPRIAAEALTNNLSQVYLYDFGLLCHNRSANLRF